MMVCIFDPVIHKINVNWAKHNGDYLNSSDHVPKYYYTCSDRLPQYFAGDSIKILARILLVQKARYSPREAHLLSNTIAMA